MWGYAQNEMALALWPLPRKLLVVSRNHAALAWHYLATDNYGGTHDNILKGNRKKYVKK
jgi:hypothetical protein